MRRKTTSLTVMPVDIDFEKKNNLNQIQQKAAKK
jgi:hypothetical protein